MLLTNSWITTLLIIEKGTGVNANISARIDASSSDGSDYGAFTAVTVEIKIKRYLKWFILFIY